MKLSISKEDRTRVIGISPATMDRLFKRYKIRPKIKGRSYTKPGTLLKNQIPIRTFSEWNENKVGFFEIDLVGHDGSLVRGDFVDLYFLLREFTLWDLIYGVKNKFKIELDLIWLGSDCLKVGSFENLPKMLVPLKLSDLQEFYKDLAKNLGKLSTF